MDGVAHDDCNDDGDVNSNGRTLPKRYMMIIKHIFILASNYETMVVELGASWLVVVLQMRDDD